MSSGYYKQNEDYSIIFANRVYNSDFILDENTTDLEFDGWKWFDSQSAAYSYYANSNKNGYYHAEEWIALQGYGATRLIALMDLEKKFEEANKTKPDILLEIRNWLNNTMVVYSLDPSPKNNWSNPPHAFESVMQQSVTTLLTP
jgi:hypothetical protein